jgi:hypothetical protein
MRVRHAPYYQSLTTGLFSFFNNPFNYSLLCLSAFCCNTACCYGSDSAS